MKKLIILKENQTGLRLKAIRSDNGGEFMGNNLKDWLSKKGIKHKLNPLRTPQCNGIAERANKSIIEMTRTMMSDSKLPLDFWAEALCTAAHVKNRIKSTVHGKTPYEMWNKRKPNIKYMKIFGCNDEIQQQRNEERHRGRPQGTTKEVMKMRRELQREENEQRCCEQNVRRPKRIKNKQAAMLSIEEEIIPRNVKEAQESYNSEDWKYAINEELASMKKHDVWDIVPCPKKQENNKKQMGV